MSPLPWLLVGTSVGAVLGALWMASAVRVTDDYACTDVLARVGAHFGALGAVVLALGCVAVALLFRRKEPSR